MTQPDPDNQTDGNTSLFPEPIPNEWKAGRAARAEQWFQSAADESARQHTIRKQQQMELEKKTKTDNIVKAASEEAMSRFDKMQLQSRNALASTLDGTLTKTSTLHTATDRVLRFPHFTALRPVAVMHHGDESGGGASFHERLFVRGLVSTLLAHAALGDQQQQQGQNSSQEAPGSDPNTSVPAEASAQEQPGVLASFMVPGATGMDVVWWEPLQPRVCLQDRALARLEALERCRVAVVVLSQGYITSGDFAAEARMISNRLLAYGPGTMPLHLLVARYSDDPKLAPPPSFTLPPVPPGHPRSQPALTCVQVPRDVTPEAAVAAVIRAFREPLAAAGVLLPAEIEAAHVYFHPTKALTAAAEGATADQVGTSTLSATAATGISSLTTGPSAVPLEHGAAWASSFQLPAPTALTKALGDWSMHDAQVWLQSVGRPAASHCPAFLRYAVDGWLLPALGESELQGVLGVEDGRARGTIMDALQGARRLTSHLHSTGNRLMPPLGGVGAVAAGGAPELFALTDQQLTALFRDVVLYYDQDLSGDLQPAELGRLLAATGIKATDKEVLDVLQDYDTDEDGLLVLEEAQLMMWDLWRLVVAACDAAAWNISATSRRGPPGADDPMISPRMDAGGGGGGSGARDGVSFNALQALEAQGQGKGNTHVARASLSVRSMAHARFGTDGAGQHHQHHHQQQQSQPHHQYHPGAPVASALTTGHRPSDGPWSGAMSVAASRAGSVAASVVNQRSHKRVGPAGGAGAALNAAMQQQQQSAAASSRASADGGSVWGPALSVYQGTAGGTRGREGKVGFMQARAVEAAIRETRPDSPDNAKSVAATAARKAGATALLGGGTRGWPNGSDADGDDDRHTTSAGTVATNLEDFADAAFTSATTLRETTDVSDLAATLRDTWRSVDLKRSGRVPHPALRAALTSGEVAAGLTPAELHTLASLAVELADPLTGDVDVDHLVTSAQEEVARCQDGLMSAVYSPGGTQQLLWKLYAQVYPDALESSEGGRSGGRGGGGGSMSRSPSVLSEAQLPGGVGAMSVLAVRSVASSLLGNMLVPFDEAPQMLEVLTTSLGVQLPLLVKAGILQEAAAAAERTRSAENKVMSWSCCAAHMLHVFHSLTTPRYTQQFY